MNISVHCRLDIRMAEQLLQDLRLHSALDRPGGISVTQGMYADALDPCFVTQLIQMRIVRAVLVRLPGPEVDEYQITHFQAAQFPGTPVDIIQYCIEHSILFPRLTVIPDFPQNPVSILRQRNGPIAVWCLRGTRPPLFLFVTELQHLIDRQCTLFPVDAVPGQPDYLSDTKPGLQNQRKLMIIMRSLRGFQKCFL